MKTLINLRIPLILGDPPYPLRMGVGTISAPRGRVSPDHGSCLKMG